MWCDLGIFGACSSTIFVILEQLYRYTLYVQYAVPKFLGKREKKLIALLIISSIVIDHTQVHSICAGTHVAQRIIMVYCEKNIGYHTISSIK